MAEDKHQDKDRGGHPAPKTPAAAAPAPTHPAPARPATGRREAPEPVPAPIDKVAVAAAVTAALTSIDQQRAATAPTPDLDETIPGGLYLVDGVLVDAHGVPRKPPAEDETGDEKDGKPEPEGA